MVDVVAIREALSQPDAGAAIVTRAWLKQVERNLTELAELRAAAKRPSRSSGRART
jgi:hypothetical protein